MYATKKKRNERFHLIPVRMLPIGKIKKNKCWRRFVGGGEEHLWWECKFVSTTMKIRQAAQKPKNGTEAGH
jgi:hypothetical protein